MSLCSLVTLGLVGYPEQKADFEQAFIDPAGYRAFIDSDEAEFRSGQEH